MTQAIPSKSQITWQESLKGEILAPVLSSYEEHTSGQDSKSNLNPRERAEERIQRILSWSIVASGKNIESLLVEAPLNATKMLKLFFEGMHAAVQKVAQERLKGEELVFKSISLVRWASDMQKVEKGNTSSDDISDRVRIRTEDGFGIVTVQPSLASIEDLHKKKIALLQSWIQDPSLVMPLDTFAKALPSIDSADLALQSQESTGVQVESKRDP